MMNKVTAEYREKFHIFKKYEDWLDLSTGEKEERVVAILMIRKGVKKDD